MASSFELKCLLPATSSEIYEAWLVGSKHSLMTGGEATGKPNEGARFTAWDGYISGKNLELTEGQRIVQSWRTTEFNDEDPDSRLEIELLDTEEGCELTLSHSEIPDGQPDYEQGWKVHYFDPMLEYFS